ncbi:hypothetical protein [Saccharicrinis fermentans]|uniref:Uncharacterized protein n=1 Tax=Saccharicrinis fermentans DSM 9555 = JCM 21142 TaxID=869213 RepID=W7YMN7_9BACT|nr:hypothetical protein [Saccharicrinis fermentans]GAF05941.1 hypothetical protein JCM21142_134706 [Saccharicrinis fermentans DSM 9555 = JCM 21142]
MLIIKTKIEGVGEKTLKINESAHFEPTVCFYRSKKSADGKFGSSDNQYSGEFGFDWYDLAVDGEGQTPKSAFENLKIANAEYLVPWLVLWPPKSVLSKYKDIDASYNPVNKAFVCLKVEKGNSVNGKGQLRVESSNPNLVINGSQVAELAEVGIGDKVEIEIEILGELTNNECINVYPIDSDVVIGKLNVLKNNHIKIVKPTVYLVNIGSSRSSAITSVSLPSQYKSNFDYLQLNSLNQALIYIKQPTTCHEFTIPELELKGYNSASGTIDYNSENQNYFLKALIESWYQLKTGTILSKDLNSYPNLSPLRRFAYKMAKKLQKSFDKHAGSANRIALTISENQEYIDKYRDKLSEYGTLPAPGNSDMSINDDANTYWKNEALKEDLLLFTMPAIKNLSKSSGTITKSNPGWSVNGKKTICAFSDLFKQNGALAHEFGHAFDLDHTFSEKEEESTQKTTIDNDMYRNITSNLENLNTWLIPENPNEIYYFANYSNQHFIITSTNLCLLDMESKIAAEKSFEITNKITNAAPKAISAIIDPLEKGETLENFMDYLAGDENRKSFTISQINTLINS